MFLHHLTLQVHYKTPAGQVPQTLIFSNQSIFTQSVHRSASAQNHCLHQDMFCFHLGVGDVSQSTGPGAEDCFKQGRKTLSIIENSAL